jgi:hypothetical protein
MPASDITLPNESGQVDPRIERDAELQRQRAFLRQSQAPKKPAKSPSLAGRIMAGRRAILGTR